MGIPPPKSRRSKNKEDGSDSDVEDPKTQNNEGDEDDWRKYFEDEPVPPEAPKAKTPGVRLHQMNIHQSLHSLASHRAVFSRIWLALLPRLSKATDTEKLAVRVLNIMHRGILPHLTRPVLVMDWISACVDYGEFEVPFRHFLSLMSKLWRGSCWFAGTECSFHPYQGLQSVGFREQIS